MSAIEVTEEQRDKMVEGMIKMLGLERKHPSKKELEEEIIDYLNKKHPCSLATCGKSGSIAASTLSLKSAFCSSFRPDNKCRFTCTKLSLVCQVR